MTIEEIKEKFKNSDKWELWSEIMYEHTIFCSKDALDFCVSFRNDYMYVNMYTDAFDLVLNRIPIGSLKFHEENEDEGPHFEIALKNTFSHYGSALAYLNLYL